MRTNSIFFFKLPTNQVHVVGVDVHDVAVHARAQVFLLAEELGHAPDRLQSDVKGEQRDSFVPLEESSFISVCPETLTEGGPDDGGCRSPCSSC